MKLLQLGGGPLLSALRQRIERKHVSLHVPGHKMGKSVLEDFRKLIGDKALMMDYTELEDVIAESQEMTAQIFGADRSFYLVNGTTVGIHASILATCPAESVCLMARNCHLSTFNAVHLAGCTPEYMKPTFDVESTIHHGVSPDEVQQKLANLMKQGSRVGAVCVVCPTYFGAVSDVQGIANVCHSFDIPLIVDNAHGGHFGFHEAFPYAALSCGADVVIQSTHKVLTSLTQSSMLHIHSSLVPHQLISKWLTILQSSSPSYLLMASLEAAALHCTESGVFDLPLQAAQLATEGIDKIKGVSIVSKGNPQKSVIAFDPLRVCANISKWGVSPSIVASALDSEFGVVPEMATAQARTHPCHATSLYVALDVLQLIVFVFGPGSVLDDARRLIHAMQQLSERHSMERAMPSAQEADIEIPPMKIIPSAAFSSPKRRVVLEESASMTCGEMITIYPPGIPLILPGEVITPSLLQQLIQIKQGKANITGPTDCTLQTLLVID